MIDPTNVTNYERTEEELQEFLLFCIAVAGKTASQIKVALERFLNKGRAYMALWDVRQDAKNGWSPFFIIHRIDLGGRFDECLIQSKLGQHDKLRRAFREIAVAPVNLRTCSVQELETIHGIGPKTSRFFVLHSRKNAKVACLDTHVLKWLAEQGCKVPKGRPVGKEYLRLEKEFLRLAKELKRDPAELDLAIWNEYSKRSGSGVQLDGGGSNAG